MYITRLAKEEKKSGRYNITGIFSCAGRYMSLIMML